MTRPPSDTISRWLEGIRDTATQQSLSCSTSTTRSLIGPVPTGSGPASTSPRWGLAKAEAEWFCEIDQDGFADRRTVWSAAKDKFGLSQRLASWSCFLPQSIPLLLFCRPDETVLVVLTSLREGGWHIGIVTNGPMPQQADKAERLGLLPIVDAFCASGECWVEKPDCRIFDEAIRRCTGSDPLNDCL